MTEDRLEAIQTERGLSIAEVIGDLEVRTTANWLDAPVVVRGAVVDEEDIRTIEAEARAAALAAVTEALESTHKALHLGAVCPDHDGIRSILAAHRSLPVDKQP